MHLCLGFGVGIDGLGSRLGLCRLSYSHVDRGCSPEAVLTVGGQRRHLYSVLLGSSLWGDERDSALGSTTNEGVGFGGWWVCVVCPGGRGVHTVCFVAKLHCADWDPQRQSSKTSRPKAGLRFPTLDWRLRQNASDNFDFSIGFFSFSSFRTVFRRALLYYVVRYLRS
jgi:hypothetical protein